MISITAPPSSRFAARTRPWWARTIVSTMARPRPVPPSARARAVLTHPEALEGVRQELRWEALSAVRNRDHAEPSASSEGRQTVAVPPSGEWWTAWVSTLSKACRSRSGSPSSSRCAGPSTVTVTSLGAPRTEAARAAATIAPIGYLTYGPGDVTRGTGQRLLPAMYVPTDRYLHTDQRDFLAVTARRGAGTGPS
jgi:hypothetical protein